VRELVFGTRNISFDTDINESEMFVHKVQADCEALSIAQLETLVRTLKFPKNTGGSDCSCLADLNSEGLFNFHDFSAFLVAFSAGCP